MFKVFVRYPSYQEEYQIAERTTGGGSVDLAEVLKREEILALQDVVRRVPIAPSIIHYALELVRMTRPHPTGLRAATGNEPETESGPPEYSTLDLVNRLVTFGAGPRAVQFLLVGAKARAIIRGRKHVSSEDIRALSHAVLRHRIITNYAAEAEGYDADGIIDFVLDHMRAGAEDEAADAGVEKVLGS